MKSTASLLLLAVVVGAVAPLRADQTDDAIVAAMKLSAAVNYSWKTTVSQNSHTAEIDGKTSSAGYSLLTFIGYGGGTSRSSGTNTVFMGDSKYVVQSSSGSWSSPGGAASAASDGGTSKNSSNSSGSGTGSARTRGNRGGLGNTGGGSQRGRSGGGSRDTQSDTPASTTPQLPRGINLPHEELALIASNYTEMHFEDGVVSGKLTEFGADLLLAPTGSNQKAPDGSTCAFRLWITEGAVTKYELKLTADAPPPGFGGKGKFSETITVELTDVDATIVDVPPAAKQKLGSP